MKTKEELEQAVVMHEEALESSKHSVIVDTQDLELAKKELKDVNKPTLTPAQFDAVEEAILEGVEEFDFSDSDNYDKEFELDYEARVELSSIDLSDHSSLADMITECVHKLFAEAECTED